MGIGLRRILRRLQRPQRPSGSPADKGWIDPEEDSLIPPRSLWVGPDDPITHYVRWTWEFFAYLTTVAGLRREDTILELGCGHGRTARGLLFYLRSPGRYVGIDVNRARIADAQERFTRRWPNFEFIHADVHSAHDNPTGIPASAYRFPFADGTFDVIYAASLFTHLLPDETAAYLRESRRVLAGDGRCLFSVFLLDHYRGHGTTISPSYDFDHPYGSRDGVAVVDPRHPDNAISYRLEVLEEFCDQARLRIVKVLPGLWSERPGFAVNDQDILLLERI